MGTSYYMYLDEAGNFDFSPKGSKHFIMTCVVMNRPFGHVQELSAVKYDCLEDGIDPKKCKDAHKFHAAEDKQTVRDSVFEVIEKHLDDISIYSVIIRKNKTNPSIRDQATLYLKVFKWLVGYVFSHEYFDEADGIVIVTDSIPVKKKLSDLRSALKKYMNERSARMGIPYRLYHHRSESDVNLQVADYCCWAIQRKWERNDARSYEIIQEAIKGEGDLFKGGDMVYYRFEE